MGLCGVVEVIAGERLLRYSAEGVKGNRGVGRIRVRKREGWRLVGSPKTPAQKVTKI
jgi:hypothetical protein